MTHSSPTFTIGIEEEYLLVDQDSYELAPMPPALMEACQRELGDQVSPEFLNCQIEIGTKVCQTVAEARDDLRRLRSTIARLARAHNLAPVAASCHPFSDWRDQRPTEKDRYQTLADDLAGVVHRLLICGMHVHVGIEAPDRRIDLMNQLRYFLPHLLALSCSSPFWQREDTGLSSYRITVFDNLPRTGLPPELDSWGAYERAVDTLCELDVIEDSSKIWWDLRPSSRFPTLESRICDVQPRMEDALTIAALTQALARMLWRLAVKNQRWRVYDNFLIGENRWRAQRYGVTEGLIDFGQREILPMGDLIEEMIEILQEDGEALASLDEITRARDIVAHGNSAVRQRTAYKSARDTGADHAGALRAVVAHLVSDFHADL